jgi:hypothetical protein
MKTNPWLLNSMGALVRPRLTHQKSARQRQCATVSSVATRPLEVTNLPEGFLCHASFAASIEEPTTPDFVVRALSVSAFGGRGSI